MKEIATLRGLLAQQLQSIFEAECSWSRALEDHGRIIANEDLKELFVKGSKTATEHVSELQAILTTLGFTSLEKRNVVADDLVQELREMRETAADTEVLDAGLIVTHQC
ncbi:MAG TPA: DUF892 family protein, partial [Flavisolibacter sp.]|nr:DUF892 family protein [Flavisolibacter sp.]